MTGPNDTPVAILLDAAMPADRLGELLRAARKRRAWSRKHAAAKAGTTPEKLRAYERGTKAVPADVCARLVECYGDDLTAHVPVRLPIHVVDDALHVGGIAHPLDPDAPDTVIAGYIDIIRRVRGAKPGKPLALRAAEITALAGALGRERDELELRIAEVLGCTREEARTLHSELLRRKVIVPVAGLAAGVAAFAGVAHAAQSDPAPRPTDPATVFHVAFSPDAPPTTTTTAPRVLHVAPAPSVPPSTALAHRHPAEIVPAPPAPAPDAVTDATIPADARPSDAPLPVDPPHADPNDTPVSVLPGETPVTIIGQAETKP